jgi:hypothetical protein
MTATVLPAADRPKTYPAVGDKLQHNHCSATGLVVRVAPHSDPRRTKQRAVTIKTSFGDERVFEMSVKNFWFNWSPTT